MGNPVFEELWASLGEGHVHGCLGTGVPLFLKRQTLNEEIATSGHFHGGLCATLRPLNVALVPHVARFIHGRGLVC